MNGIHVFTLRGIPVFISMWYFLLMGFLFLSRGGVGGGIWVAAITISILVHEFGHALVARYYELKPAILLHGWGGLCAHSSAERDRHDVLILAMGPGAGLILGAIAFAVQTALDPAWLAARPLMAEFIFAMVWINIFWSFINLVPLWPLDGGQLFQIGLKQKLPVGTTHKITHGLGLGLAGLGVVVGLSYGFFFAAILAGLLAFENWRRLQAAPRVRGKVPTPTSKRAGELYEDAVEAMGRHDWAEAARLGHLMRDEQLADKQLARMWELLTVATTNLEEWEEALRYAKRAPDTEPVRAAKARCLEKLGAADISGALSTVPPP